MDFIIAIALGAAIGAIPPYLERSIVPWIGLVAVLAGTIWFVIVTFDGLVGLAFGVTAPAVSSVFSWYRSRRARTTAAQSGTSSSITTP